MSTENMAVMEPMLPPPFSNSTFSKYNCSSNCYHGSPIGRRGSDANTASPMSSPMLPSSSSEAMVFSTSPTLGLDYLASKLSRFTFPYTENETRRPPMLKSRSFPKAKHEDTPPQSPTRPLLRKSKSVKFADSQGLPLVKTMFELTRQDSPYTASKIVPYSDDDYLTPVTLLAAPKHTVQHKDDILSDTTTPTVSASSTGSQMCSPVVTVRPVLAARPQTSATHQHVFQFDQPSLEPDFYTRVRRDYVVLESIREEPRSLHGFIAVYNLAYDKEVIVRWTHDNWKTSHDTHAVFVSHDVNTDRFAFELPVNGDDVIFAICYRTKGTEHWDNNRGANYKVLSLQS